MKRAVCLLTIDTDGKILAVTRKGRPDQWGLPGGKVDDGETDMQALIREVKEETGLDVNPSTVKAVWSRECLGETDYETVAYYMGVRPDGTLHTEEPILISWVTPEVLMAGPFGVYNAALFRHLGIS